MRRFLAVTLASVALIAAHPHEISSVQLASQSSTPEAVFIDQTNKSVAATLASLCMDASWGLEDQSETQVVCATRANELLQTVQTLAGPRGAQLRGYVRFSLVELPGQVRVQARSYTEQTNAFGQTKTYGSGGIAPDDLQDFLIAAGGSYAPGVKLDGIDFGVRGFINKERDAVGLNITRVNPDGAAAEAGIHAGDRIIRINGKKFRDEANFRWRAAKADPGETVTLTIDRNGEVFDSAIVARAPAPDFSAPRSQQ